MHAIEREKTVKRLPRQAVGNFLCYRTCLSIFTSFSYKVEVRFLPVSLP